MDGDRRARYERNILIPGIGEAGQERLARARVCVVGLGGLGGSAAYYLAAAGVGHMTLVDSDRVELSNLQRQILHTTDRLGYWKTESAELTLRALNPEARIQTVQTRLTSDNAGELLSAFDAVIEATDNYEAKFLINDTCIEHGVPFATAGILALSGQCLFVVPGKSACLRCLTPNPPTGVPTTGELGVLGAVPGMLGSLETFETVRYLVGLWRPRRDGRGALHSVDGDTMRLHTMEAPRRPDCRCAPSWSNE